MCIAIVQTAGKSVTDAQLWRGWTINGDGAGFAYVDPRQKKVVIKKGFLKFNEFQKAYREAVTNFGETSPFLVHMRIGTSGQNSEANTHPFEIKPQVGPAGAMIHNGILFTPSGAWRGSDDDRKSDTRVVANALNNILVLEDIINAKEMLGRAIGGGNKLAFLYDTGDYVIINEGAGHWNDGIWYSNGSCSISNSYHPSAR
jgi:glutamine phosphoribosylpyrophosphate amidotransferase